MTEIADKIFDTLGLRELARFAACGTIFVVAIALQIPLLPQPDDLLTWLQNAELTRIVALTIAVIAVGVPIGFLIYALHRALVYPSINLIQVAIANFAISGAKRDQSEIQHRSGCCAQIIVIAILAVAAVVLTLGIDYLLSCITLRNRPSISYTFAIIAWLYIGGILILSVYSEEFPKGDLGEWKNPLSIIESRDLARWKAEGKGVPLFEGLREWGHQVHMLYCCAWSLFSSAAISSNLHFVDTTSLVQGKNAIVAPWIVASMGLGLLYSGFVHHLRYSLRESRHDLGE